MDDLFRFITLKPPEPVEVTETNSITTEDSKSSLQSEIKECTEKESVFDEMVKTANKYISSRNFISDKNPLSSNFRIFVKEISKNKNLTLRILKDIIRSSFNLNAKNVIKNKKYINDRLRLADSLIALTIIDTDDGEKYENLVEGLKLCGILEKIANDNNALKTTVEIKSALNSKILLPESIFPLHSIMPISDHNQSRKNKTKQNNNEKIETEKKLKKKCKTYQKALEELINIHPDDFIHFPDQTTTESITKPRSGFMGKITDFLFGPQKEEVEIPITKKLESSPFILSTTFLNNLSNDTKGIINELKIPVKTIPLYEVANVIESHLLKLSNQFSAAESNNLIKIGSNLIKTSDLLGKTIPGDLISPYTGNYGAFRSIGMAELMVVKQEIKKYESGEIAHIENVLKGETKKRTHRRTKKIEETYLTEVETTEEIEKDLQSTERFELQKETQETIQQESNFGADITVKYGGFVDITANTRYSLKNSKEQSTQSARNYSKDITERAVSKIQERVKEKRVRITSEEFEETNLHKLTAKHDSHTTGIYRWVDKIYINQIFNYGWRLMFEFNIPEPASFTFFSAYHKSQESISLELPKPPVFIQNDGSKIPLKPSHITFNNYEQWISQYKITNYKTPPPIYSKVAFYKNTKEKSDTENNNTDLKPVFETISDKITLPKGYKAVNGFYSLSVTPNPRWYVVNLLWHLHKNNFIVINIGKHTNNIEFSRLASTHLPYAFGIDFHSQSFSLDFEEGAIPFFLSTFHYGSAVVSIEILCVRTEDAYNQWKQETYEAIVQAYLEQKSKYDEQVSQAEIEEGIAISGRNPALNRELEKTELKKGALTLLTQNTSPHFHGAGAIRVDENDGFGGYPEIDFNEASREGSYIQYLENAFEWNQMAYTFYPYYWARKDKWAFLQQIEDYDPLHAQFLQAGSARVVVPVRPGFKESILYFLDTNKIWSGSASPNVHSNLYLPIIQEIKEKLGNNFSQGEGKISVTINNNEVIGNGTKFTDSDVDREIYIKGKRYRIATVDETTQKINLTENYIGQNKNDISYSLGVYFVGEPWELKIPTSLVYLQKDSRLSDFNS